MNKFRRVAVIGSRKTPATELEKFVEAINDPDVIVTSGNATGADQFSKYWKKNIQYLPWKGFNQELGLGLKHIVAGDVTRYDDVIKKLFPWLIGKSQGLWRLVRRSACMIGGIDGTHPVEAVFYWADEVNGVVKGGTRYAVDFARSLGIPTFNLKTTNDSKPTVCNCCGTVVDEEYLIVGMCPECLQCSEFQNNLW
jgi:hypothetical protein